MADNKKIACAGGWAAKLSPLVLEQVLKNIPKGPKDENLLIGFDTSDDAAVYKINDDTCFVQTIDFFPPMVDDPYLFGQIAAANSISDIYAMGARPVSALNMVCFPKDEDLNILQQILKGSADKVIEAGATTCGGHSIDDTSIKFGLAVTGIAKVKDIKANNAVREGDVLILTKPLGVGIVTTARNNDVATKEDIDLSYEMMSTLNKYAFEIISKYNVSALTDVTGFGFAGHLNEMLNNTNCSAVIDSNSIPIIDGIPSYVEQEMTTGGGARNQKMIQDKIIYNTDKKYIPDLLSDPQTSGGLLIAIDKNDAEKAISELQKDNHTRFSKIVGNVTKKQDKAIIIN